MLLLLLLLSLLLLLLLLPTRPPTLSPPLPPPVASLSRLVLPRLLPRPLVLSRLPPLPPAS